MPHAGSMCLLHRVERVDARGIVCRAVSHRASDNPLRRNGRLCAIHAVEYGAQAIAAHRSLTGGLANPPDDLAFLGSLKQVLVHVRYLDDLNDELEVQAHCLLASGSGAVYDFAVTAGDARVCEGRATVVGPMASR